MKDIKNVLICGIGAIGSIYADKINRYDKENLKILVDENRLEKYRKTPKNFNGKSLNLNYVLPSEKEFKADLIIIATKFDGLRFVLDSIGNFLTDDTIIISLINGVTSEEIIASKYGWKHLLLSYFIGHSSMRNGNMITFDGVGKIVFGIKTGENTEQSDIIRLKNYFEKVSINYETPDDMLRSYWLKYMLNVSCNQLSAITGVTFGQMQSDAKCLNFIKNTMQEVIQIAKIKGVNVDGILDEAIASLGKMCPEGKTSMLQDIEAGRKTELEIFADTMINFGKQYKVLTPYNNVMKELIEIIQ